MKHISIAIDGPSGAGKSTLARKAAHGLGFRYLDTGAIYRTVGLYAKQCGVDPADERAVSQLLDTIRLRIEFDGEGVQHMLLMGQDVSQDIRLNEISGYASKVSAIPQVRAFLLEQQREFARTSDVVMDGRDIGTVVLPHADVKIFLTASAEERAGRRYRELLERGQNADFAQVLEEVIARDKMDTDRAAAPLRKAEDAVLLDTTGLTEEESLARLLEIIKRGLGVS